MSYIPPSVLASLAGIQTLTNKSIAGNANTLSNIGNTSLANSALGIVPGFGMTGGGQVALGATLGLSVNSGVITATGVQSLLNKALTTPIIDGISGASGTWDLSGATGAFKTPRGLNTFGGATNIFSNPLIVPAGSGTQTGGTPITIYTSSAAVASTAAGGEIVGQTYTMPANTLNANGQSLRTRSGYLHAANTNATTWKWYFNNVAIGNASLASSGDALSYELTMVRLTSTTLNYSGTVISGSGGITVSRGTFSGLDFTAAIVIKNSVTAAVADGDLTATHLVVQWWPA